MTHALTSYMVLVAIIAVYSGQKLVNRRLPSNAAKLAMFSALFLLAYSMFHAPGFFDLSVERTSEFMAEIWESGVRRELSRVSGSPAQAMSYFTSWGIVLLTGFIASLQALYVLYHVRSRKQTNKDFSVFTVIWLVLVILFALTSVYGSHEAYQRAFMFGLIPLTYLCISLLSKKPKILLLVICGLLFLNIPAQYGSDTYRLATDGVLTGTRFFVTQTPQNVSCLYSFYPHIRYFDPLKYVRFVTIPGTLPFTSIPEATTVQKAVSKAEYIIRSDLQHNYYIYFLREDPFEKVDFDRLNRIYDSQSFRVFKNADAALLP
ncbi:hypothetical protein KEJ15_05930 [Candidatus Bathyarchaeota archaeon]|nr:hypothetical protein [Candidatus Bathyarchaeota archaeon]